MQQVKNIFHLLVGYLAALLYYFPGRKMTVIGITGTDGKTTTCHLLYHILQQANLPVSLISTVQAVIAKHKVDTGFHTTSPNPFMIQKLMRQAVNLGTKYMILEVTSHALDQYRTLGSSIDIALITNISHEHLDYHHTLERYRDAKARILSPARFAILNRDDPNFAYLTGKTKAKVVSFSLHNQADYQLKDFSISTSLPGRFNQYNILASSVIATIVDIDKKTISKAISSFPGVPGRLQEIKSEKKFKIYIDFAHKINALKEALTTARGLTAKKLIVVIGCAGLRDRLKRPIMGEIAAALADYIVLTAEDPRTEDVRDIIDQIAEGCLRQKAKELKQFPQKKLNREKYFMRIPDRQQAINFAIRKLASSGDTVIICGKGHEKSMCYGTIEYPWDEKKAVQKALYGTVKTSLKIQHN